MQRQNPLNSTQHQRRSPVVSQSQTHDLQTGQTHTQTEVEIGIGLARGGYASGVSELDGNYGTYESIEAGVGAAVPGVGMALQGQVDRTVHTYTDAPTIEGHGDAFPAVREITVATTGIMLEFEFDTIAGDLDIPLARIEGVKVTARNERGAMK